MLTFSNQKVEFSYRHCQQCGICETICPRHAISVSFKQDGTTYISINEALCILCKRCVDVCPANKLQEYNGYINRFINKKYYLAYNVDDRIRGKSSSGGVGKTIAIESLKHGLVDGVYTLKKIENYPFAEGEFYTRDNIPNYEDIPNSIYHSIPVCKNVDRIKRCKRLLLIGTACQLRAMSSVVSHKADEVIKICIFCKQQKTLDSTRFFAKIMGTSVPQSLKFFVRYRGEGWPGIVQIDKLELPWNRASQIPFGRRLWTVPGCDICGDSFGVNIGADITLMDPWKIRTPNNLGETLLTVHTDIGLSLINNIDSIVVAEEPFEFVERALSLKDVWRKQQTEPFFRGQDCSKKVYRAGRAELLQRKILAKIVNVFPKMPVIFYRILCKVFPDLRNILLR